MSSSVNRSPVFNVEDLSRCPRLLAVWAGVLAVSLPGLVPKCFNPGILIVPKLDGIFNVNLDGRARLLISGLHCLR